MSDKNTSTQIVFDMYGIELTNFIKVWLGKAFARVPTISMCNFFTSTHTTREQFIVVCSKHITKAEKRTATSLLCATHDNAYTGKIGTETISLPCAKDRGTRQS